MKQAIVDRFEGTQAVLLIEDQPMDVPRSHLPPGIQEGDYLQVDVQEGKLLSAERDETATEAARQRIAHKLARLRRGNHLSTDS